MWLNPYGSDLHVVSVTYLNYSLPHHEISEKPKTGIWGRNDLNDLGRSGVGPNAINLTDIPRPFCFLEKIWGRATVTD